MKRDAAAICTCGTILFLCLFGVITPVASSAGHSEYEFPPKVIVTLLIGAALIVTACVYLIRSRNGKENSN